MPWCRLSQVELFYHEKGQGAPLVFLNGLSGDHSYWMGQIRYFAKRYRCLAPDQRDTGQTKGTGEPYAVRDMARDVLELLDNLGLPTAHLLGLSMGGMVAQEVALTAPDRVRSLVLVSTAARTDAWFAATLAAFEHIRRQVADTPAFFEAILPWWVSWRYLVEEDRVAWLKWLLKTTPHPQPLEGFLRQLEATRGHDAVERVSAIRCPALLVVGEDDGVLPPRYTLELKDKLPHAEIVTLAGVGHAPPLEAAGPFQHAVAAFLEKQEAGHRRSA